MGLAMAQSSPLSRAGVLSWREVALWGGWSPRLTPADLAQWPNDLATSFQDAPVGGGAYSQTEREIGVSPATDYISGPLYDELHAKMDADPNAAKNTGTVPNFINFIDLSDQSDEFNVRRAWVNLVKTPQDDQFWKAMDDAAIALAQKMAGTPDNNIQYSFYNQNGSLNAQVRLGQKTRRRQALATTGTILSTKCAMGSAQRTTRPAHYGWA